MAAAGLLLLTQTSMRIAEEKKPSLMLAKVGDGWETNLHWQQARFVPEVGFDGEVSLEKAISNDQIPEAVRPTILGLAAGANLVKVESVYSWGKRYYEVYIEKAGTTLKYEIRGANGA